METKKNLERLKMQTEIKLAKWHKFIFHLMFMKGINYGWTCEVPDMYV